MISYRSFRIHLIFVFSLCLIGYVVVFATDFITASLMLYTGLLIYSICDFSTYMLHMIYKQLEILNANNKSS